MGSILQQLEECLVDEGIVLWAGSRVARAVAPDEFDHAQLRVGLLVLPSCFLVPQQARGLLDARVESESSQTTDSGTESSQANEKYKLHGGQKTGLGGRGRLVRAGKRS